MSDPIFQGTLQDMIKGIRSNKKDPSSFISKEIADIKTELRSTDPDCPRKMIVLRSIIHVIHDEFHLKSEKLS